MVFDMSLQLSTEIVGMLFLVAVVAGFIDSIAGGGSFFASFYFIRKGMVNIRKMKLAIACTFVGSALGSIAIQSIDASILEVILPFLILTIGGYFLFSKQITDEDKHQVLTPTLFAVTAAFGVGLYDGFFGPGTGSFFALAFVSLAGFGLAKATAHAKVLNFATNIASLLFFALGGKVLWALGGIMLVGQALGATLGSRLVLSKGVKIIKPLMVTMSIAMNLKLLLY